MAAERDNTATALTPNHFARTGYRFASWNTRANGSGTRFSDSATYSFKTSMTLYAQWTKAKVKPPPKAPVYTVTFNAHGGKGSMAAQRHAKPESLEPNRFSRSNYTFIGWNTTANGSGTHFANKATYPFTGSGTLYAQWRHVKVVAPPPITSATIIGYFAQKSSALTPALEAKVASLAALIEKDGDKTITLVGYGDKLSATQLSDKTVWAANYALSQRRAEAVATYLNQELAKLGAKSYTVSAVANGLSTPSKSSETANQAKSGLVVATLS